MPVGSVSEVQQQVLFQRVQLRGRSKSFPFNLLDIKKNALPRGELR